MTYSGSKHHSPSLSNVLNINHNISERIQVSLFIFLTPKIKRQQYQMISHNNNPSLPTASEHSPAEMRWWVKTDPTPNWLLTARQQASNQDKKFEKLKGIHLTVHWVILKESRLSLQKPEIGRSRVGCVHELIGRTRREREKWLLLLRRKKTITK